MNCIPISFFVDKEKIYVFSKEKNDRILKTCLVITEIDANKETQKQYDVPLSAMGLECLDNTIYYDNIFILDNVLFFSFHHLGESITVAACDLETMRGTYYTLSDKSKDGRLFVKDDKIGLMVMENDLSTTINWFDFDRSKMEISENRVLTVDLESMNGKKYEMYIFGYNFYYIDGCLCGIVYDEENQNKNIAYVEIDANTGDILTCVAIEKENSQYMPWNYLIRDNEAGYQRFSIN